MRRTVKGWVTLGEGGVVLSAHAFLHPGRPVFAWHRVVPCTITFYTGKPARRRARKGARRG